MDVFARNSSGNILASGSASGSLVRINVDVPAWDQLGQRTGYQFVKAVDIIKDQFSYYNYSGYLTGSFSSQASKWFGGVLAPNGSIYFSPYSATSSLKINTTTNPETISFIGSGSFGTPSLAWVGGALAPNNKIYMSPSNNTNVAVINTNNDSVSLLPFIAGFYGAVTANDGNVYFVPYSATVIGKVNTADDTIATFGSLSAGNKYVGGVLAPNNGCIYCVPYDASTILKINPVTQQLTTFGSFAGSGKWFGGVLGPNGLIYCAPFNSTGSLIINPFNDTFAVSGSLAVDNGKYSGGALGLDGNVYCAGNGFSKYLKINTVTNQLSEVTITNGSRVGMVLAPNGKMYGIPHNATSLLVLSMNVSSSVDQNIPLSRYLNKF